MCGSATTTSKVSLFVSQSFRGIPQGVDLSSVTGSSGGGSGSVRQVEAKYPALLFKQQLTAYVEKIYGMIRDNLKKEITPLLASCIQVYSVEHLYGYFIGCKLRCYQVGHTWLPLHGWCWDICWLVYKNKTWLNQILSSYFISIKNSLLPYENALQKRIT